MSHKVFVLWLERHQVVAQGITLIPFYYTLHTYIYIYVYVVASRPMWYQRRLGNSARIAITMECVLITNTWISSAAQLLSRGKGGADGLRLQSKSNAVFWFPCRFKLLMISTSPCSHGHFAALPGSTAPEHASTPFHNIIYIYTYTYTHTHIYIYIYIYSRGQNYWPPW